jgi:hypothetical protein
VLIAEQLVLLCINPQRGEFELGRSHADMDALAAAGLLLDLYEQKRLRFNKQHVAVDGKLPTTHPQLEAAAHVLSGPTNGLPIAAAIDLMVARLHPLAIHLLESLFRRDVLHRVRSSWWPFSPYRFPLRSLQARNEAIQQLSVAVKAETPSVRGLGLLVLVDLAGQLATSLAGLQHEAAADKVLHLGRARSSGAPDVELVFQLRQNFTR